MTLRDSIFPRNPGESDAAYWARIEKTPDYRSFQSALSSPNGTRLVQLLISHRNPTSARFARGRTIEESAFLDGQMDVIATLMLYGTNLGISKPVES